MYWSLALVVKYAQAEIVYGWVVSTIGPSDRIREVFAPVKVALPVCPGGAEGDAGLPSGCVDDEVGGGGAVVGDLGGQVPGRVVAVGLLNERGRTVRGGAVVLGLLVAADDLRGQAVVGVLVRGGPALRVSGA